MIFDPGVLLILVFVAAIACAPILSDNNWLHGNGKGDDDDTSCR